MATEMEPIEPGDTLDDDRAPLSLAAPHNSGYRRRSAWASRWAWWIRSRKANHYAWALRLRLVQRMADRRWARPALPQGNQGMTDELALIDRMSRAMPHNSDVQKICDLARKWVLHSLRVEPVTPVTTVTHPVTQSNVTFVTPVTENQGERQRRQARDRMRKMRARRRG